MIRRRRKTLFVVLLVGIACFVLVPFFSQNHASENDSKDYADADQRRPAAEVELKKGLEFGQGPVKSNQHNDNNNEDFSEIEYAEEEEKYKFQVAVKSQKDPRLHVATPGPPTLHHQQALASLTPSNNYMLSQKFNAPGHKGRMVRVDPKSLTPEEQKLYNDGWATYFHNEYVNKFISAQRTLLDVRDPVCRFLDYPVASDLPVASVVIAFYNEAWMTLLRTVHSVLDRSPAELLAEVILVDDASTLSHLGDQLNGYVSHLPKVRLLRLKSRKGASIARHMGASQAKGRALVFLDSHCECTKGWLEPLLNHIARSNTNVAVPVIDIIDDDTFAYIPYDMTRIRIGGFDWSLVHEWIEIPVREKMRRKNDFEPIRNPLMFGGIFAISLDFFNQLGGFEQNYLHKLGSGQDSLMSFKIWLCGGSLETIPCSHVGHLFHQRIGHKQPTYRNLNLKNHGYVAMMWLDEFKDMHFKKAGLSPPQLNNTAHHLEFRDRLQCHSFDWYLRNVYPELFAPSLAVASGKIKSKLRISGTEGRSLCVGISDQKLVVNNCHSEEKLWLLSRTGEIRQGEDCLDYPGGAIIIYPCHGGKGNQEWTYREDRMIQQIGTKLCLTLSSNTKSLKMEECTGSDFQVWYWRRNYGGEVLDTTTKRVRQELAVV